MSSVDSICLSCYTAAAAAFLAEAAVLPLIFRRLRKPAPLALLLARPAFFVFADLVAARTLAGKK
jgi:hypothetical protein